MNTTKLIEQLDELNVNLRSYSIGGSFADEQYVIEENHGVWLVYYAEKGLRTGLQRLVSEDEACHYFFS